MRSLIREIRKEKQLLLILSSWFIAGLYLPIAGYVFVPLSFLFFIKRRQFSNLFVSLLFLFMLSDNRVAGFDFATTIKPIIVSLLFSFLYINRRRLKISINHPLVLDFVPFLIVAFLCILFSPVPLSSTLKTVSYLLFLWTIPVIFMKSVEKDGAVFFKKIFISVFFLLFSGLLFHIIDPHVTTLVGRYRGWFGNPNGLGIFITLWFMSLFIIQKQYPKLFDNKRVWKYMYLIIVISLFMCSSRTALVAIAIFLLFYKLRIRFWSGMLITIVSIFLMPIILENIELIIISLDLEDYARLNSLKEAGGRTVGLDFGWEEIKTDWYILGKGFGYTIHFYKSHFQELIALNHVGNAHNSYISAWLNTGLIGMILFVFAWAKQLYKSRLSPMCFPVAFSCLFSSFLESWLIGSLNPFTIILLLILLTLQNKIPLKTELKPSI
jgi:O-antigen ligase